MSGFPPEKPIETITEEKRVEEDDDQKDPEEETLTGPLHLPDSFLNVREDSYRQQELRDDYPPIVVSGSPASCSAINEVNKDSCSSSSSSRNKSKEHVIKKNIRCQESEFSAEYEKSKKSQESEFSDFENSQIQSTFGFLDSKEENQYSHPSQLMTPLEENLGLAQNPHPSSETVHSSLGLVQNQNLSSVTQPREENQIQSTFEFLGFIEEDTSLVDRSDQTVNQQVTLPNHGSSARSHHQSNLNPHAPLYIPSGNTYQQQQRPMVNQIPNQQQQFTIPNHGSISSARSDQNQPFGRQLQLNRSTPPPRSPQPVANQMGNAVPQMITPGPAYFNQNISASIPVPQHLQMGMVPSFDPNLAQLMHQPHHFMSPGTNVINNQQQQIYMTPETIQHNQMMYNHHQQQRFRNMGPIGQPRSFVVDQNYYNQQHPQQRQPQRQQPRRDNHGNSSRRGRGQYPLQRPR